MTYEDIVTGAVPQTVVPADEALRLLDYDENGIARPTANKSLPAAADSAERNRP